MSASVQDNNLFACMFTSLVYGNITTSVTRKAVLDGAANTDFVFDGADGTELHIEPKLGQGCEHVGIESLGHVVIQPELPARRQPNIHQTMDASVKVSVG
jgi:hypothetical protein